MAALVTSAVRGCAEAPGRPPLRVLLRGDGARVLAVVHDASSLPAARLGLRDPREARLALSASQFPAGWGWMPAPEGKLRWCLLHWQAATSGPGKGNCRAARRACRSGQAR